MRPKDKSSKSNCTVNPHVPGSAYEAWTHAVCPCCPTYVCPPQTVPHVRTLARHTSMQPLQMRAHVNMLQLAPFQCAAGPWQQCRANKPSTEPFSWRNTRPAAIGLHLLPHLHVLPRSVPCIPSAISPNHPPYRAVPRFVHLPVHAPAGRPSTGLHRLAHASLAPACSLSRASLTPKPKPSPPQHACHRAR